MNPEITHFFPNRERPGAVHCLRVRRDTDGTFSIWMGGAPDGETPSSWGGISGLTEEMVADLPVMFNAVLPASD